MPGIGESTRLWASTLNSIVVSVPTATSVSGSSRATAAHPPALAGCMNGNVSRMATTMAAMFRFMA
jgi:hypothetical protein